DERLVAHAHQGIVRPDDARPARGRAVGVTDDGGAHARGLECPRAGDGERRLARSAERRAADRDHARALRPGEALDEARRRGARPDALERPRERSVERPPFQPLGDRAHGEERTDRIAAMEALDPARLAERQLELDRARTARFPDLLARKLVRMSASPLAFLRGAAPLFYEILHARRDLEDGPPGEGWLVGDAHLENFGAYRPDPYGDDGHKGPKKAAVFNLNDFDEAVVAPWRWDVLRLTTSLILGGRELGADGMRVLGLSE